MFDRNGELLGLVAAERNRTEVSEELIPQSLEDATVAIEDKRFYKHGGVDYSRIVGAAVHDVRTGSTTQGGSTITMQLIKNLYDPGAGRTFTRKLQEAYLAYQYEGRYSKEEILTKYLNGVFYGNNAVGVEAAAQTYFDQPVTDISLPQAALLAGLPQAPSAYDPFDRPEVARERRNTVLDEMAKQGYITDEKAAQAKAAGLGLKRGTAYHLPKEAFFFEYVRQLLVERYGVEEVQQGGFKVYTTVDPELQEAARTAIDERLSLGHRPGRRGGHDRHADRVHPGDGLEPGVHQPEPVQLRGPGRAPDRLVGQDLRAGGGDRGRHQPEHGLLEPAAELRRRRVRADRRLDLQRRLQRPDQHHVRDARLGQHRLHPAGARRGPGQGRRHRRADGHPAGAPPAERRLGRPGLGRGDPARHGGGLRAALQRRPAGGAAGDRARGQARRDHRGLQAEADARLQRRRGLRGDQDPRGERPGRHRRRGAAERARRRQDRHHRRVRGRLVRRLHAPLLHLGLGRLPQRRRHQALDVRGARPDRVRRQLPGRDLGRLHAGGDRGRPVRGVRAADDTRSSSSRSPAPSPRRPRRRPSASRRGGARGEEEGAEEEAPAGPAAPRGPPAARGGAGRGRDAAGRPQRGAPRSRTPTRPRPTPPPRRRRASGRPRGRRAAGRRPARPGAGGRARSGPRARGRRRPTP